MRAIFGEVVCKTSGAEDSGESLFTGLTLLTERFGSAYTKVTRPVMPDC